MDPFHGVALAGHKTLKPEEPTILVSNKLGGSILVSAKRWSGCLNYPLGTYISVAIVCCVAAHDASSARPSAVGVPAGAV
ncbi:hypothetical protein GCM10010390_19600 [Streptomyces mordarskii]|uniref:Transposase n=1 Tax=Streptomyces mordarskii TaxID=1226758 RepID=A0ABN1CEB1_9ACTN